MTNEDRAPTPIPCRWCAEHRGQSHKTAQGELLYDRQHHAGQYVTPDEAARISADGP